VQHTNDENRVVVIGIIDCIASFEGDAQSRSELFACGSPCGKLKRGVQAASIFAINPVAIFGDASAVR
jgi:hypothetical protein